MIIEKRTQEIVESMKSFPKATYQKSEVLPELLALQQELVTLAFNEEHAGLGKLRLWDVESHLAQMNDDCGGVATDSLRRFQSGSRLVCNIIKSEISGNRGESKAFYALKKIRANNITLKNIELIDKNRRTELDVVVITQRGAFIIEVKNTSKDIFIDEDGNYYRTGEYLRLDSNIGAKLSDKKSILQTTLQKNGLENVEVFVIVVFTNNRIEVRNRCDGIQTCFLEQIPYIVDEWNDGIHLTTEEMSRVAKAIDEAKCEESYPLELDVDRFKRDFATLMAELETASTAENEETIIPEIHEKEVHEKKRRLVDILDTVFTTKHLNAAGAAAAMALTVLSALVTAKTNINFGGVK